MDVVEVVEVREESEKWCEWRGIVLKLQVLEIALVVEMVVVGEGL